jgi:hypothetical protein
MSKTIEQKDVFLLLAERVEEFAKKIEAKEKNLPVTNSKK